MAARDKKLMADIVANSITLEICPTSNLRNSVVKNVAGLKTIIKTFLRHRVKFAVCTDGPEMYKTNIAKEQEFILKNRIMNQKEIDQATKWAFEASFIR